MSETVALFAEATVERAALVVYLDEQPSSAGDWRDWGPLLDNEVGAPWRADPAGFVDAVDARLGPTNRATARGMLESADRHTSRCDYDAVSHRLSWRVLTTWEGVVAVAPFLVFARGLSRVTRGAQRGYAAIRWADIDLMASGIDVAALVAIGADGRSRFLDATSDAAEHARLVARSNAVFADLFDRLGGAGASRAVQPVETADLVARLEAMSERPPPAGTRPDAALAGLAAIR